MSEAYFDNSFEAENNISIFGNDLIHAANSSNTK